MRYLLCAALVVLAACQPDPDAANQAEVANRQAGSDKPGENMAAPPPAPTPVPDDPERISFREASLEGCIGGARDRVPDPAVRVEEHCACAVERVMAGRTMVQLRAEEIDGSFGPRFQGELRQCISEMPPL